MGNKTLAYVGLGVILLLLIGTFAMGNMNGRAIRDVNNKDNTADHHGGNSQPIVSSVQNDMSSHHGGGTQQISLNNEDLSKYRSEDIPADCRLPDYDNDVNSWREHLGHHQETQYCLEYYK